ncbi:AbrB/MazE/SpoVT family DNA-binding domain-containing protein [Sphingobium fluviale]|jgi:antitoxin VapB|uniref:AbrB family transcriptional regulator n=1 Tax=Sphingobium fluviale TaxID=2506423 RepID=A0A4Q1KDP7_9SPHN|nr:AbrB/MazE/SpoVT family DNA-binding domain-containing protein [Sphingobium fluviale]RXR26477.1 AbrB family transcriptional regulator [Sphingobium fluviale]
MTEEYKAKVFKSGNSVALRLPKALGIAEGDDIVIAPHADGSFTFWKEDDGLKVLMGLYGSFSPGFMSEGRGDIEQEERDWSPRKPKGKAA